MLPLADFKNMNCLCCLLQTNFTLDCLSNTINLITAIATLFMAVIAGFALRVSFNEYKSYRCREKTECLSKYNERYTTDRYIRRVVTYLINSSNNNHPEIPPLHDREMFLRFFEELMIAIETGVLDRRMVKDMFSYYAEEYASRKDLMKEHELEDWTRFLRFVEIMNNTPKY